MKRPKRAGSLSHRELEEYIWKRARKEERNEKEASRERTDTERIRVGEGAQSNAQKRPTRPSADDTGMPWRDLNVRNDFM